MKVMGLILMTEYLGIQLSDWGIIGVGVIILIISAYLARIKPYYYEAS
jgi:hypothetical protein